jgi:alkaline phosphatase
VRGALLALLIGAACGGAASRSAPDPRLRDPWFAAGQAAAQAAEQRLGGVPRARGAILFVGDGMGITTVTAARILQGQLRGESGEENALAFERLPWVALAKTYNTDAQVPDSAGTMTAMASGVKTRAGSLGVGQGAAPGEAGAVQANRVATLLEEAEARGLATGIVSTARITHATPAALYAHVPERDWESDAALPEAVRASGFADIARQLVELPGDGPELVLGGGRAAFLPREARDPEHPAVPGSRLDGRDLIAEWRERHPDAAWVWNAAGWKALDPAATPRVLGLFEPSHMQWEEDRAADPGGEPSLAEMTAFALDVLARDPDGFFLMVEAGRIDHAHHAGNARRALIDTIALSDAVERALAHPSSARTLVVVTADHSHVLSIAGYPARGNPILGLVRGTGGALARDALGLPYTTLGYANGPGYPGASPAQPAGAKRFPHMPAKSEPAHGRPDLKDVDTAAAGYLQESGIPLPAETHGGEDVPIYAGGPGAALLHGVQEQNYVYHAIARALGWLDQSGR